MKKRDIGIILGMFFVLMAVYFPITAFVFNGGFASAIGIEAFSLNAGLAAIITALIYILVVDKSQTEANEEEEENEEEDEGEGEGNQEKEKEQPKEEKSEIK